MGRLMVHNEKDGVGWGERSPCWSIVHLLSRAMMRGCVGVLTPMLPRKDCRMCLAIPSQPRRRRPPAGAGRPCRNCVRRFANCGRSLGGGAQPKIRLAPPYASCGSGGVPVPPLTPSPFPHGREGSCGGARGRAPRNALSRPRLPPRVAGAGRDEGHGLPISRLAFGSKVVARCAGGVGRGACVHRAGSRPRAGAACA